MNLSLLYLHFCKPKGLLGAGFKRYGSETELGTNPINHLFDVYVETNKMADKDPAVQQEAREFMLSMEEGSLLFYDIELYLNVHLKMLKNVINKALTVHLCWSTKTITVLTRV